MFVFSGLVEFWLYEKLEANPRPNLLSSAPEPATASSESPAATESTESSPAAKAATAEAIPAAAKSSTAKTITTKISTTAAALEVLEALAGKIATRPVLSLPIQIIGPPFTTRSV